MSLAIKIKHSGKVYDINVDLESTGIKLKEEIFKLTNVPTDRQKILVRGGPLKDDAILSSLSLRENQVIMMLGTPLSEVITNDENDYKIIDDSNNDNEIINSNLIGLPSGLTNLGNTCYLNSSIQLLNTIEELKDDVKKNNDKNNALVNNMKELFNKLDNSKGEKITPLNFLSSVRDAFPQFQERSREGFYKQQDAEESYSQILRVLIEKFPDLEKYFKIEMKSETKCLESNDAEDVKYDIEDSMKLNCHINGQINFLIDGLKNGLKEKIEKNNERLGRNAQYEINRKITELPKYLTINFVRFYWKRESGKKAKIMRKVQFPFELDLMELIDESKREKLIQSREEIYKVEKEIEEEFRTLKKIKLGEGLTTREQYNKQIEDMKKIEIKSKEKFEELKKKIGGYKEGSNLSSLYELIGVIAHQGASADSGHYQAFIKDEKDLSGDRWYKFNDDIVTIVDKEKIRSLSGGSEGDSALVLLYKGVGM